MGKEKLARTARCPVCRSEVVSYPSRARTCCSPRCSGIFRAAQRAELPPVAQAGRRRCPRCLRVRAGSSFSQRREKPAGYCAKCRTSYLAEYHAARYAAPGNRVRELAEAKAHYAQVLRPARIERKLRLVLECGGQCARCGYARSLAALDFDHRDPREKKRTVSHLLASRDPSAFEAARSEAVKCDLLCANCHREKTHPGLEIEALRHAQTAVALGADARLA